MQLRTHYSLLAGVALTCSTLSALGQTAASGPAATRADDTLLEMAQAYKKADRKRLATLLPQVKGHPLEPWAAYWELKARLDDATAQEVTEFTQRYAGTYQEDRLRNDWLLVLGQRKDWAAFASELPRFRMADDREVACYGALVEHLNRGTDTSAEVRRHWHALRDSDRGCTLAAATLWADRQLPALDVWRKARLAMESNRPTVARAAVEIVAPNAAPATNDIHSNAARYLGQRVLARGKVRKELVVLALVKMASNDPDSTASILENKWSVHLDAEERNWAWGTLGKQAAQRLGPFALEYFGKVTRDADLTDDMLVWKARAALRAGQTPQWDAVLAAINAMSDTTRQDSTWVYWRARALKARATDPKRAIPNDAALATALFESIASVKGFYEQLALEELGRSVVLPPAPSPLREDEKAVMRQHPGLNRALAAIELGLRSEGVREWNFSTNLSNPRNASGGMNERELLAAADLACQRQVWDRCINTSERTKTEVDFTQRFPMPFRDAVLKRSREIDLDPAYVYGLIRQESRFIMDARSHVGAAGLMQVMPPTAKWTARKIGLTQFKPQDISDRDTNIAIGTAYLKFVLDDFGGSLPMAAAAYNAGPSRPRAWRGQSGAPVLETAVWAENIPLNETRDYVKKVLANTTSYAALISGQPQSLKARLGHIGPRDAAAPAPNTELP